MFFVEHFNVWFKIQKNWLYMNNNECTVLDGQKQFFFFIKNIYVFPDGYLYFNIHLIYKLRLGI